MTVASPAIPPKTLISGVKQDWPTSDGILFAKTEFSHFSAPGPLQLYLAKFEISITPTLLRSILASRPTECHQSCLVKPEVSTQFLSKYNGCSHP